ncbi:hypothetical protein SAMN05216480_1216 [Pustulibacterium marinum]|uniref:Uncharacterized protein n=1 Tax=Pustulibacterium marinum TaxID=1224947 RepID=A0A1I7ISI9_9FLAO|nr:hypothetical protein [Pustulibacterium marinum]SFU75867.1 hypothetical protein SAMN05216480_1216 [Pustulibacterium marinum]
MRKKLPVIIPLVVFNVFTASVFFGKGMQSGPESWRFYASLTGFLIAAFFLVLVLSRTENFKTK